MKGGSSYESVGNFDLEALCHGATHAVGSALWCSSGTGAAVEAVGIAGLGCTKPPCGERFPPLPQPCDGYCHPQIRETRLKGRRKRRVVFDIETEPFSLAFKEARTAQGRIDQAPKMRLACLYDERDGRYFYFLPGEAGDLIKRLRNADEVISFNGKCFDLPVLQRHHGLAAPVPTRGRHVDLLEVMREQAGFRVSLDQAAKLNLGQGKHTLGRDMMALDLEGLKTACRSDVRQTYELWKLHKQGWLKCPATFNRRAASLSVDEPGPANPVLEYAALAGLRDPDEPGEMSDGEQAEYTALLEGGGDDSWAADFFGFDPAGYRVWRSGSRPPARKKRR